MTLRVVVISSVAERSLLPCVNQHVCAISSTTFLFCVFLLSRTDFLPVCKKDRGLRSGCDDTWEAVLISKPIPNPCFQTSGCRVQGCGAVHKNIEAPQSIDGGDSMSCHFSHQTLLISQIPSHSFLLSNFKVSLLNRFAPHAIMSTSSIYIFIDIVIYKEDPHDH